MSTRKGGVLIGILFLAIAAHWLLDDPGSYRSPFFVIGALIVGYFLVNDFIVAPLQNQIADLNRRLDALKREIERKG